MAGSRLTTLDGSFLRLESPAAHMHVGWKGFFAPRTDGAPVTVAGLRDLVAGRLRHAPRFRQRLAFPPGGIAEPVWVDAERFDIRDHVDELTDRIVSLKEFHALADDALSQQLDRARPLWRVLLAPALEDGTIGMVMQVHHAMVDGKSAVELALLLLDVAPDAPAPPPDLGWRAAPAPSPTRLTLDAVADSAIESLRMARSLARTAIDPARGVRLADTLRRAALSVGDEVRRPAPASYVNRPIGPQRTLLSHTTDLLPLLAVKRRMDATLNDVALAVVAGAMRELSVAARRRPAPLRVMVPVSVRRPEETASLGNRISFVFIDLPVHRQRPFDRLVEVRAATQAFKRTSRSSANEAILGALALMPPPLKNRAARIAASPRLFNLTISNVPGPRQPVYLLGAELLEAVPVIPLADDHPLSIGIFTYREALTFGCYADPVALPEVAGLPAALDASVLEMTRLAARPRRDEVRRRRRPAAQNTGASV